MIMAETVTLNASLILLSSHNINLQIWPFEVFLSIEITQNLGFPNSNRKTYSNSKTYLILTTGIGQLSFGHNTGTYRNLTMPVIRGYCRAIKHAFDFCLNTEINGTK